MDHEHILALVEAIHGADLDAVHGFAANAAFIDDVGQLSALSGCHVAITASRCSQAHKLTDGDDTRESAISLSRNLILPADGMLAAGPRRLRRVSLTTPDKSTSILKARGGDYVAYWPKTEVARCPTYVRDAHQTGHPELARKVLFHSECVTRRAPIVHQLAALAIVQSGVRRIDDRAVSVLYSNLLMMGQIDFLKPVLWGAEA